MKLDYVKTLPEKTVKCQNIKEFARLKKGKRSWKKGNLEPDYGTVYYIYSITHKVYWRRQISEYTNFKKLRQYVQDGNAFIEKQQEVL